MRNAPSYDRPDAPAKIPPAERQRVPERSGKMFSLGAMAVIAGMSLEGCAATARPGNGPGTFDWYTQISPDGDYTPQQKEIWKYYFEHARQDAATISHEEQRALNVRLETYEANRLPEAQETYNEVALEHAWQNLASVSLDNTQMIMQSSAYEEDPSRGPEGQAPGYRAMSTLVERLRENRPGVYQLHVTQSGYNAQLTSDNMPTGGAGHSGANATLRFSEGAEIHTLLPPTSPRLRLERQVERVSGEGYGRSEGTARMRALVNFMTNVSHGRQPVMVQSGAYLMNRHTINLVEISSRSSAYYLENVRFQTSQVENPDTGTLRVRATVEANVVTNAIPQGHRLATTRGRIEQPLFPLRQE